MSYDSHHDIELEDEFARETIRFARRRTVPLHPSPRLRWLWLVGIATVVATLAAFLIRQEPHPVDYAIDALLLGSLGLLAFVSAGRALNLGVRYEETVLQVEEVKESYRSLRQIFCHALDMRDHVTGGHCQRVATLSVHLGQRFALPDERLRQLEWAAFLHDIGKVRVSDGILAKPGPLDDGEWSEMRQHPFHSYSILAEVPSLRDAAEIVFCHHERFDGMGYPRGLLGEQIPIEARIFAVVDAYDAMLSDRPYRRALPHEEAVREIISHAGTQFDPQVVRAFVEWATSEHIPISIEPGRTASV